MIRVGILGCAHIARRSLAPAFAAHPAFTLQAVASRTAEKAAALAAECGGRASSYDELVHSDDIDLVYCPLPTGLHYDWVRTALANRKHVLCEKSLACRLHEVEDLVGHARAADVLLMESFQFRFHAQNLYAQDLFTRRTLGDLTAMEVRFSFPKFQDPANIRFSRALGGGALLDCGAYTLKCATYFMGHEIDVIRATRSAPDPGWEVDRDGELTMVTPAGQTVHASYSMDSTYHCGYTLHGTLGQVTTARAFTAPPGFEAPMTLVRNGQEEVLTLADDHFQKLLDHIALCISAHDFEAEYAECLTQARLLNQTQQLLGLHL